MVRTTLTLAFLAVLSSVPALAHDFWAGVEKAAIGEQIQVFQGFGHGFPVADEIKADVYAERFEPVRLVGLGSEIKLTQGALAQNFVSEESLAAGSYYVLAASKLGFASRTPNGFVRKSRAEEPSAVSCSFGANFGKNLLNLGQAGPEAFVSKPVGHKLEIVPQVNPWKVKVGDKFPVKVLFDGQPLPAASVGAFFAGFSDRNAALAFQAETDQDGLVDIVPLRPGNWLAKVSKSDPYPDESVCGRETYSASLAFSIVE
ncbi:MAG: DUF4198 domain-containing protein [Deltaproteobacteria bacterium]|jgi:uncharacterized GH25 family protein|nr:DUF4198 domain-containing protein [Deltaproteobacteria bacterium]